MAMPDANEIVQRLLEEKNRNHLAWVNRQLATPGPGSGRGFSLLNPFGGYAGGDPEGAPAVREEALALFESGSDSSVELLQSFVSDDMICLVVIERAMVRLKGRDHLQPWVLRVTQVYRRDGDEWRSVHRHADPLIERQSLDDVLELMGSRPVEA
jgi:hypothetical protein